MVQTADIPRRAVRIEGGDEMATQLDRSERIEADFVVVGGGSAGCALSALAILAIGSKYPT
jgi:hypothetical protein